MSARPRKYQKEDTPAKEPEQVFQSYKMYLQEFHRAPSDLLSPSQLDVIRKIAQSTGLEILGLEIFGPSRATAIIDERNPFIEIRYYAEQPDPNFEKLVRLWDAHLRWILNDPTGTQVAIPRAQPMYFPPQFAFPYVQQFMIPPQVPLTFGYVGRPATHPIPIPIPIPAPPTNLQPLSGNSVAGVINHGIIRRGAVAGAHHNFFGTPERAHQDQLQQMKIPSAPQIQNASFQQQTTGGNKECAQEEFKYPQPKQSKLLPLMNLKR